MNLLNLGAELIKINKTESENKKALDLLRNNEVAGFESATEQFLENFLTRDESTSQRYFKPNRELVEKSLNLQDQVKRIQQRQQKLLDSVSTLVTTRDPQGNDKNFIQNVERVKDRVAQLTERLDEITEGYYQQTLTQ